MSKEQIIEEAIRLNSKDREWLAEMLLLSINSVSSEEVEKLWTEEIERRVVKILSGTAILHDGDEVINRLLSKYKEVR